MAKRKMTTEQYVKYEGNLCPFCRSEDTTRDYINPESLLARNRCNKCGGEWDETYSLTGYIDLR